jgi:hypothetical protein
VKVPIYYPDVFDPADASFLHLKAGDALENLVVLMRASTTARIEGCVLDTTGQPAKGVTITVRNSTVGLADCHFAIGDLVPGRYVIVARSRADGLAASQEVYLQGDDLTGLRLVLQRTTTVAGSLVPVASEGAPAPIGGVRVQLLRFQPSLVSLSAMSDREGRFAIPDVVPGRYQVNLTAGTSEAARAGDLFISEVASNGQPVSHDAIEISGDRSELRIAVTKGLTRLVGSVSNGQQPVAGQYVVVFPREKEQRLLGSRRFPWPVRTATDGTFEVTGLPIGAYLAAVVSDVSSQQLLDSSFLEALAASAGTVVFSAEAQERRVSLVVR